jgi:hypothetical protein
MTTDTMALLTMFALTKNAEARKDGAVVPEPEFKRFRFPKRDGEAVRAAGIPAANTTRAARTLEELGVPKSLARELESSFRVMGLTRGDKVTGFTFRAADGGSYALKTSKTSVRPADVASDLAA